MLSATAGLQSYRDMQNESMQAAARDHAELELLHASILPGEWRGRCPCCGLWSSPPAARHCRKSTPDLRAQQILSELPPSLQTAMAAPGGVQPRCGVHAGDWSYPRQRRRLRLLPASACRCTAAAGLWRHMRIRFAILKSWASQPIHTCHVHLDRNSHTQPHTFICSQCTALVQYISCSQSRFCWHRSSDVGALHPCPDPKNTQNASKGSVKAITISSDKSAVD